MPKTPKRRNDPPVLIEWRDPPPKIGRRRVPQLTEILAGIRIRQQIEQSRRARGIPPEGTVFPGETADVEKPQRRRKATK